MENEKLYKVDDNGDYEWVIDPDTNEAMSPRKICDLLNGFTRATQPAADLSAERKAQDEEETCADCRGAGKKWREGWKGNKQPPHGSPLYYQCPTCFGRGSVPTAEA